MSCLRFNRRPRRALLSAEASANVVSSQSAYSAFYSGYLTPTDVKFRPSLETHRKICPLNNPASFPEIFRIAKIFPHVADTTFALPTVSGLSITKFSFNCRLLRRQITKRETACLSSEKGKNIFGIWRNGIFVTFL